MMRLRTLGLALVAVFALSAVAVGVAFAASESNPQWEVNKALLAKGKEKPIEGDANGTQKWISEKTDITAERVIACTKDSLSAADIMGGEGETSGSDKETITYSGCSVEGFEKCTVKSGTEPAGTIKTEPLTSEAEYKTKEAAEKEKEPYIMLFKPRGRDFFKLKIEGTCPSGDTGETVWEGQVALEAPEGGVAKEVHELVGPETPVTAYWHNKAKKAEEVKVETIKTVGLVNNKYVGKSKVKLTSKETWNLTK